MGRRMAAAREDEPRPWRRARDRPRGQAERSGDGTGKPGRAREQEGSLSESARRESLEVGIGLGIGDDEPSSPTEPPPELLGPAADLLQRKKGDRVPRPMREAAAEDFEEIGGWARIGGIEAYWRLVSRHAVHHQYPVEDRAPLRREGR